MGKTLMQIMQPEIDVVVKDAVDEAVDNTTRTIYFTLVQKGKMTLNDAADEANMSTADFSTAMTNAGYKLPKATTV